MLKKLKDNFKVYFSKSKGPKVTLVLLLVVLSIAITVHSMKKTISVIIDGKEHKIVTYKSDLKNVLINNKMVVGQKDKITPSLDTKIEDGQLINIKKAVDIEINVDGKKRKVKSAEKNVSDMLKSEGVALGDMDKILPLKDSTLKKNMKIVITRVKSKVIKETKPIEFSVVKKNDNNMGKDETKIVQQGVKGEKEITTQVVYEDGKEVSKKITSEKVVKSPVNKVVNVGTLGVLVVSRGGRVKYKNNIKAQATAYTSNYQSTGKNANNVGFGITATGTRAKRNRNGYSSIAVDPRIIPLGTKLYIPGYGYGIAEDVGGAIKGNIIDLYFNSQSEAMKWGRRWVDVYILK